MKKIFIITITLFVLSSCFNESNNNDVIETNNSWSIENIEWNELDRTILWWGKWIPETKTTWR